jgi:DNA-binding beta-propeller fold protein YncE
MKYRARLLALVAVLLIASRIASAQTTATNFTYPQSLFVDSQNGNIWVADFDNNRVMRFDVSTLTGVFRTAATLRPDEYVLAQNYPNPFNPATTIEFALRNTEHAAISVYTVLGQKVTTLFDGMAQANTRYVLSFNATHLPSGMYFYELRSTHRYEVKKMNLLK